ncbi:MAG: DNA polymerase III subunit gamma/tau, partial [Rhodospirillaceae bacterium]|nr:DNA polymerase III subunit gamma/tau [Rhodospirillaceae bacterium]
MSKDATTDSTPDSATNNKNAPEYRVLARKYRPGDFSGLIGQEALVRTLTNAILSGRLAHAFMLTGVRGVGKTTTARIIARALNCVGVDGKGGPTAEPCGVCEHCVSISNDNHMDVIEMDAASRTGVDDIREVIEGVRFKPVSARYKVYIIDEVHMLSKNAFNALLKTLEEPPEHIKFIFATTEIRKVPVTVLSRCQRFDLRRIDMETLTKHFKSVVAQEGASVSDEALQLISRAADGSVRDGLSLLDQAIAHTKGDINADTVRDMLGLADRTQTFELFEAIFKGDAKGAVEHIETQYQSGADPLQVLQDLLDLCHWITRIKVSSDALNAPGVAEMERVKGAEMAGRLSMADLTRMWQMLLKGIGETRSAPSQIQGAEMVLVRLIYGLSLPSPADALQAMKQTGQTTGQPAQGSVEGSAQGGH